MARDGPRSSHLQVDRRPNRRGFRPFWHVDRTDWSMCRSYSLIGRSARPLTRKSMVLITERQVDLESPYLILVVR